MIRDGRNRPDSLRLAMWSERDIYPGWVEVVAVPARSETAPGSDTAPCPSGCTTEDKAPIIPPYLYRSTESVRLHMRDSEPAPVHRVDGNSLLDAL